MHRIVNLEITLQAHASPRARKNIVRRDNIDGPYRNRVLMLGVNIPVGPDSNANSAVRRIVIDALRDKREGEILFYVRAEFEKLEGKRLQRYFKTIVPRSEIPV